jgi:hypothetical protein
MFTRVVNLLTFKMAVFQGGSGGNKDAGSIHLNPLKNSAIRCNFRNLSEAIRTYPQLSGVVRGSGPQKSEPIRGSEDRNPNLSEAIWTYPKLSEPSRFFFRWPAHSVAACPHAAFHATPSAPFRAFPRLSAHQIIFPSIRLMSPSCRTLGVSSDGLEPGWRPAVD